MLKASDRHTVLDLLHGKKEAALVRGEAAQRSLFELLKRHRMLSLVPRDILNQFEPAIQARWLDKIRRHTIRAMQLTAELTEVIEVFRKENLNVYAIKGPILAQRLYGDVGGRHFSDIDLVAKQEELPEIIKTLDGLGFIMVHPSKNLTHNQWEYYFRYKKDVTFMSRAGDVVLELHVDIFRQELIRADPEGLSWDNLVEERIGPVKIKCLNLNTSFLYLIYHGGQHQYFRLFWLKDIADAMRKWNLDHSWILKEAINMGIDRLLGMGMLLAQEFFNSDIPEEYESYISENRSVLTKLRNTCHLRIFGPERESRLWKIRRYRFVLLLQPGFGYFRSIIGNIFHRRVIRKKLGGF